MKQIMYFAAVLAIAMLVALNFGLNWLFVGIGVCFIGEYCLFTVYERSTSRKVFDKRLADSKKMFIMHIAWCICTFVLAMVLGVINGYDIWEEIETGNTFKYEPAHIDGIYWWVLLLFLIGRGVMQAFIEKAINENIELLEEEPF